jgi:hypothetical protein
LTARESLQLNLGLLAISGTLSMTEPLNKAFGTPINQAANPVQQKSLTYKVRLLQIRGGL